MNDTPIWQYDEFGYLATDFHDPEQVATYDSRQQTTIAQEQALVATLGINKQHTVLEYGIGTGAFMMAATAVCHHFHAVDISEAMLAYAKKQATQAQRQNVSFHHAGFLTYQHAAQRVDFIVTKYALHHLPDFWKTIALQKMNAQLKPGGLLYIEDVIFSFPPQAHKIELQSWIEAMASDGSQKKHGFSRADFEGHIRDEYSTFTWLLEAMLQQNGFTIENKRQWSSIYSGYLCRKSA